MISVHTTTPSFRTEPTFLAAAAAVLLALQFHSGFSGADLHSLCMEAIKRARSLGSRIRTIDVADMPAVGTRHFTEARLYVEPSGDPEIIQDYLTWNKGFGYFRRA